MVWVTLKCPCGRKELIHDNQKKSDFFSWLPNKLHVVHEKNTFPAPCKKNKGGDREIIKANKKKRIVMKLQRSRIVYARS